MSVRGREAEEEGGVRGNNGDRDQVEDANAAILRRLAICRKKHMSVGSLTREDWNQACRATAAQRSSHDIHTSALLQSKLLPNPTHEQARHIQKLYVPRGTGAWRRDAAWCCWGWGGGLCVVV